MAQNLNQSSIGNENANRKNVSKNLTPVRVVDIIMDITHEKAEEYGGYDSIGMIFYADVHEHNQADNPNFNYQARPFFQSIKQYPLKNEIVLLLTAPSKHYYQERNANQAFYLPNVNIWNHPHNNALPDMPYHLDEEESKQDSYIGQHPVRNPDVDDGVDVPLGNYFKENLNIQPLLSFEGDTIFEGRFGNSIRFGATAKEAPDKTAYSTTGNTGDPITIIRNGQHIEESDNGWEHTIENINTDHSTIYLTSNQVLPNFKVVSTHWQSWMAKHDELDVGEGEDDFDNITKGPEVEVSEPEKPTEEDDKEMEQASNEEIEADEDVNEDPDDCKDCDEHVGEFLIKGPRKDDKALYSYEAEAEQKADSENEVVESTAPTGEVVPPPPTQENSTPAQPDGEEVYREGNCSAGMKWGDHDDYEPGISGNPPTLDGWSWTCHEGAFSYKGFNINYCHAKDGHHHITQYQCEPAPGEKYEERGKKAYVYENAGGSDSKSQTEGYIQEFIDEFDEDGYIGWDD